MRLCKDGGGPRIDVGVPKCDREWEDWFGYDFMGYQSLGFYFLSVFM